jgi:hypothetical protein
MKENKNQGKYHLVSVFLIPTVLASYLLGGWIWGLAITIIAALIILSVFRRD